MSRHTSSIKVEKRMSNLTDRFFTLFRTEPSDRLYVNEEMFKELKEKFAGENYRVTILTTTINVVASYEPIFYTPEDNDDDEF